ncbi:unnamed protein product [Paramecium primaurelia]|uniref:Tetrapyrrole methylase domain-containing protein n=1 Tax=Paramecium primaurelia TaxID=5886 RepID=A0A8S1MFW2_PARPR|nr:unnamed protein product [Paramecium primaurelia]
MIRFATRLVRQFSSKIDEIIDIGKPSLSKGILTICPTPIGNLQDWTPRQDKALFEADVIACEDTRITGFLIKMIKNKKLSNEQLTIPENPKEYDLDDDDFSIQDVIFDSTKQLQLKLPELNQQEITAADFNFYKQKKIEEMKERVTQEVKKQKEYLSEQDPLNFMGKQDYEEEMNPSEFEVYGLTAPFMVYLKTKIAVAKKRKGRGILISCHKFNEEKRIDRIIAMLKMGLNITLVCDAGTPAISDPGYQLVNKCIERNVKIEVIPGPSAISVALSTCGFPTENFSFLGFLSKEQHDRDENLRFFIKQPRTLVLFESPSRVHQTLLTIEKIFGETQQLWIGFELTKKFEKKIRGKCREVYEMLTDPKIIRPSHLKGEVTIIIAPYTATYNDELRAEQFSTGNKQNEFYEEEEENIENLIKNVEALQVAQAFGEKFHGTDREFNEVLQKALRISKTKATKLIVEVRHMERIQQNLKKIKERVGEQEEYFK